ncbi:MAG: DUF309 domain-containing protein [Rhodobacteraceae bacterium]|nr:DUF309 domain-containing protein [Paracoccaceae bacterium]
MIPTPPYAYIPGQTPRHDEALFAEFAASVECDDLTHSLAWRAGLHYLEHGFFWESHEALEPVWMVTPPNSAERHMVQALIQFANASLKLAMQRPKAALRLCDIADEHLGFCTAMVMGLDVEAWRQKLQRLRSSVVLISAL